MLFRTLSLLNFFILIPVVLNSGNSVLKRILILRITTGTKKKRIMKVVFCITYLITLGVILWYFKFSRQKKAALYCSKIKLLNERFEVNKSQREIRKVGLMKYDFLRYNLKESLILQHEILL